MKIKEWCVHYIKARDAMTRKLVSIDEKNDKIIAHYKDKEVTFLPTETLPSVAPSGTATIVCLQNEKNFDILINRFEDYAKNQDLTVMFLNPTLNEKWVLKPAVHAAVADNESLKTGLRAMFDTVPAL